MDPFLHLAFDFILRVLQVKWYFVLECHLNLLLAEGFIPSTLIAVKKLIAISSYWSNSWHFNLHKFAFILICSKTKNVNLLIMPKALERLWTGPTTMLSSIQRVSTLVL